MKYKITIDKQIQGFGAEIKTVEADAYTVKDGIFCFYNKNSNYHYSFKPANNHTVIVEEVK